MSSDDHAFDDKAALRVLADSGLGNRLLAWRPLAGGISATVYQLDFVSTTGEFESCVLRCHGDVDYGRNPLLAADEFQLVNILHSAGASVPRPRFLGAGAEPLGRPYALYDYVPGVLKSGGVELLAVVPQLAQWLATLHNLKVDELDLPAVLSAGNALVPRQALRAPVEPLDPEILEPQIRRLLGSPDLASGVFTSGPPVLLHGDYWSGNVIWRDDSIAAVIDWEDFGVGDALADLSCARLELLWAAGESAMRNFTASYFRARQLSEVEHQLALAYWDLCAVLPFAHTLAAIAESSANRPRLSARLEAFVARAFAELGATLESV